MDVTPSATNQWVRFRIEREEITTGDVDAVILRLRSLSDIASDVNHYRNRVIPHLAGLDVLDPDDWALGSQFMRQVTNEWPFWFHFIPRDLRCLRMVLCLLCDSHPVRSEERGIHFSVDSRTEVYHRAAKLFDGACLLYGRFGFAEHHYQSLFDEIVPLLYMAFPRAPQLATDIPHLDPK